MGDYAFMDIPEFKLYSSIIHSFIKTSIGPLPIITANCIYTNKKLLLINWSWLKNETLKKSALLQILNQGQQSQYEFVNQFNLYITFLIENILAFITQNKCLQNRYTEGDNFSFEIDIKTNRKSSNYFHHDGGVEVILIL